MMDFKEKWNDLDDRERLILAWGSVILSSILYYSLILNPLLKDKVMLSNRVNAEKMLYKETQQQVQKIRELGLEKNNQSTESIQKTIDDSLLKYQISPGAVPQIKNKAWQLSFTAIKFSDFIAWLDDLQKLNITTEKFSITRNIDYPDRIDVENVSSRY